MHVTFSVAKEADAAAISALRCAAAEDLTLRHGRGHWSHGVTERGALRDLTNSRVLVARRRGHGIVGTLTLATKKPWAIDRTYFRDVPRALYLTGMAVAPAVQGLGIGRRLLEQAVVVAGAWPAQSIRLDAYAAAAGAGGFYAKCGFREVGRAVYRTVPLIYYELGI